MTAETGKSLRHHNNKTPEQCILHSIIDRCHNKADIGRECARITERNENDPISACGQQHFALLFVAAQRTASDGKTQRCLIFRILFHYLSLQIKENDTTHTQKRGRKRKKRNKIEFAPIQWQKINAPLINWTDVTQFFFFFYCLFRSILFTIARTKMYIWQFLCWRQTCAPSNESTFTI